MNFQNKSLPTGVKKVGSTPMMTEDTVVPGLLKNHLAPKGKIGYLVVEEGSLEYIWEDDVDNVLTANPEHPIVIFPERFHHVVITGKVLFKVEFYELTEETAETAPKQGERPGTDFI